MMRRTLLVVTSLALIGCPVPPGALTGSTEVEAPDGLVVPVGGTLRFGTRWPSSDVTWGIDSETADRATIDATGRLTALRPGRVRVLPSSRRGPWAWVDVAVVASPIPAENVLLTPDVRVTGQFSGPILINRQEELDRVWADLLTFSPAPPAVPTVDFERHSLVLTQAVVTPDFSERDGVITHFEPPHMAHMTFPRIVPLTHGISPYQEKRVQIQRIDKVATLRLNYGGVDVQVREVPPPSPPAWVSQARLEVTPFEACVGSTATVIGQGYPPGMAVDIRVSMPRRPDQPQQTLNLARETVGDDGTFAFAFTVTQALWPYAIPEIGDVHISVVPDGEGALQGTKMASLTLCGEEGPWLTR